MLANWLSNIKWALVLAIFAGPAFAYWSYTEGQTFKHIMADGVEAAAVVDGGESRSSRRGVTTSYKIHAIWTDDKGAERAENIEISSEYAGKIIEDDYLLIESANVKYLPNEPEVAALVSEDGPQRIKDKEMMTYLGAGAGGIGLIGSAIFFLGGRRKKPEPAKEPPTSKSNLGF
jgi:hypothetical protein